MLTPLSTRILILGVLDLLFQVDRGLLLQGRTIEFVLCVRLLRLLLTGVELVEEVLRSELPIIHGQVLGRLVSGGTSKHPLTIYNGNFLVLELVPSIVHSFEQVARFHREFVVLCQQSLRHVVVLFRIGGKPFCLQI